METQHNYLVQGIVLGEIDRHERKSDDLIPQISNGQKSLTVYDPLPLYLMEIKRYRLLTREEEVELAIRYQKKGDSDAGQRLVMSNLRLVVKIVMDFQRYWTQNLLDLIQEGNLGLLQAIKKFDPFRGVKFSYYASFWIKAYILKFIMENWKLVKIGTTQNQRKLFFKLQQEKEKLVSKGMAPETRLLSERLDVDEKDVSEMDQRLSSWDISLNTPVGEDSSKSYEDFLSDSANGIEKQISENQRRNILSKKIDQFHKHLSGREAYIFKNRIMSEEPLTLQNIGHKYNISRERVRQIQEKLIKKMRIYLKQEIPNFEEEYIDIA